MDGLNSITLMGNVGTISPINVLDNDKKIINLTLVTTTSHYNQQGKKVTETEWHDIVLWNYLADLGNKHIKKGTLIYVEGKVKYRNSKADGTKITEVIAKSLKIFQDKTGINNISPSEKSDEIEQKDESSK